MAHEYGKRPGMRPGGGVESSTGPSLIPAGKAACPDCPACAGTGEESFRPQGADAYRIRCRRCFPAAGMVRK